MFAGCAFGMNFYGILYRLSRLIVRTFFPRYRIENPERLSDPSIYLCRHFNSRGVFMTLPWLPGKIRTWSLHLYHDRKICYRHLMDYTLTQRYGWPRWKAWMASVPISGYLQALMRSGRTIPVYRNSMKILETYQTSLDALKKGESLLIFPDRDYTSTDDAMGDMYDGFLMMDRLYYRETKKHIPFIPLRTDPEEKTLYVGRPVLFAGDIRDQKEKKRVYEAIRRQLNTGTPIIANQKDR